MKRILILAGTDDARRLAETLMDIPGLSPIASLASETSVEAKMPCPVRTGGFGGADGLAAWINHNKFCAITQSFFHLRCKNRVCVGWVCTNYDDHIRMGN